MASSPVRVDIDGPIAWVTIDNPPVNATSTLVRAGLLDAVKAVQDCDLAILQCAGKTFIAGGDMTEFDAPPVEPHLPDVVRAIEASETPFLAILHGTVLGGGFEIAMACAHRIAKPPTRFGLPEVNLGLVPGAGGTQRAPRLLGWELSVEMACLGQLKSAEELEALGALDLISETPEAEAPKFMDRQRNVVSERSALPPPDWDELEARVTAHAKGRDGPHHNLRALKWATQPYEIGQPKERQLHLQLRQSAESKALRHVFFAERSVTRPNVIKAIDPRPVSQIAIVGGGLMGSGIATACLNAGLAVTVLERNDEAANAARETISSHLQKGVQRGKLSRGDFENRLSVLRTTTDFHDAHDAQIAIEAVFEDLGAKRTVFAELANAMAPDALLATNTSYLNPNEIFANVANPDRCLGLHFFSPAHIMKLVEVVRADQTSSETIATGFALARSLGKTPVLAGVCDGFIGNRILAAYRRAAEYLLADGALPFQIDAAMRGFGMAMGPFEAQDMAGLQIAEANRRRNDANRSPDERYVPISDQLCAEGRYGKRSGAGWYRYDSDGVQRRDPHVEAMITSYAEQTGIARQDFSDDAIQFRLLAVMANEGARIVEEGIAENDATVDVVKTSGYGFPRRRGGPMHWAEAIGSPAIRATLDDLEAESSASWIRAKRYC